MEQPSRIFLLSTVTSIVLGGAAGIGGAYYVLNPHVVSQRLPMPTSTSTSVTLPVPVTNIDEQQTKEVVERVSPAVVSINISKEFDPYSTSSRDFFSQLFDTPQDFFSSPPTSSSTKKGSKQRVGGGSGFLVSSDGYIVTNKHVVADTDAEYTVVMQDQKTYPATVIALDPSLDLAIMKIEGANFPWIELGNSEEATVGQTVIAIGNALAEFQNTVTKGIISGLNRHLEVGLGSDAGVIEQAIQTDAAINFGNSGGPLLDLAGKVVGMNTAISESAQSLGFALPSNVISHAFESVRKNGRIVRPWLGIRYIQIDEEVAEKNKLAQDYGVLISKGATKSDLAIIPGSPANKAGLVENDIILECNGQKLDGTRSLSSLIAAFDPGQQVSLKILHEGQEKTIQVTLEERKETP